MEAPPALESFASLDRGRLERSYPGLRNIIHLSPGIMDKIDSIIDFIIGRNVGDFTWATDYHPRFISDLMRYGFLPMASEVKNNTFDVGVNLTFATQDRLRRHHINAKISSKTLCSRTRQIPHSKKQLESMQLA